MSKAHASMPKSSRGEPLKKKNPPENLKARLQAETLQPIRSKVHLKCKSSSNLTEQTLQYAHERIHFRHFLIKFTSKRIFFFTSAARRETLERERVQRDGGVQYDRDALRPSAKPHCLFCPPLAFPSAVPRIAKRGQSHTSKRRK